MTRYLPDSPSGHDDFPATQAQGASARAVIGDLQTSALRGPGSLSQPARAAIQN